MTRLISFLILVALVALSGLLFYQVMAQFLLPIFLAAVLVVIFRPLHQWMVGKLKGRHHLAALATTLSVLVMVLVPMVAVLALATAEAGALVANFNEQQFFDRLHSLRRDVGLDMPAKPVLVALDDALTAADGPEAAEADRKAALEALNSFTDSPQVRQFAVDRAKTLRDDSQAEQAAQSLERAYENLVTKVDEFDAQLAQEMPQGPKSEAPSFEAGLANVSTAYQEFKIQLYGGPWMMWLKSSVNPEPDEQKQLVAQVRGWVTPWVVGGVPIIFGVLGGLIVGFCIMIVTLYFFLADGPAMVDTIMRLSPLAQTYEQQILFEFDRISRAVVVATLLSALVQALLAAIGYYFAGLHSIFLLTVVTFLLAMVPFVGAASVWGACSLYLWLFLDNPVAAGALAAYGTLVISMADNVIKPYVLHGQSNLHPLLALLSVLGGVKALGPIGIFVGPMVVAFLQAALNMLRKELYALDGTDSEGEALPAAERPPIERPPAAA